MTQLQIDLYDEAVRNRIEHLFWELAQRSLFLGQSVILESGFWLRSDRDEKRLGARVFGASVQLHVLDVPLSERWHRIKMRNAQGVWGAVPIRRDQLAEWDPYFEAPTSDEVALFDPLLTSPPIGTPEPGARSRSGAERFDIGHPLGAVFPKVFGPGHGHRNVLAAPGRIMTLDKASVVGVFPHRKARTRRPPRIEHLEVGALARTQPFKEIENQVVEVVRHKTGVNYCRSSAVPAASSTSIAQLVVRCLVRGLPSSYLMMASWSILDRRCALPGPPPPKNVASLNRSPTTTAPPASVALHDRTHIESLEHPGVSRTGCSYARDPVARMHRGV